MNSTPNTFANVLDHPQSLVYAPELPVGSGVPASPNVLRKIFFVSRKSDEVLRAASADIRDWARFVAFVEERGDLYSRRVVH